MLDITQFFPFFSQKAQCQAGENEKFPLFLTHTSGLVDRVEFQYNRSSGWIVKYYRNGNIMLMLGLKGKYDAWNRLVETRDSSNNLIARYDYNGLNQRIKKTVGSVVTKSFFNDQWQELDSVTNADVTSYIWGLRYIDDLIYRQRGTEKLYSLADPNWNIVATTNATGTVQERMRYDAFGKVTWLNATFGTKTISGFAWNRTFTGQVLDTETSLMLYRNRYYHTGLGRFVTRDPIGYDAGDESLYRYAGNRAGVRVDTYGLEWWNDGGSSDWINPFAYSAWAGNAIGEWWKQCGECTPKNPPETILHFSDPFPAVGKPALIDWGHNMMDLGDTATMIGAGGNLAQGIQGIPSAIGEAGGTVATPISPHEPGKGFSGINNPGNALPFHLWVVVTKEKCEWCCPKFRGGYYAKAVSYFQCTRKPPEISMWHSLGDLPTVGQKRACLDAAKKANPKKGNAAENQTAAV